MAYLKITETLKAEILKNYDFAGDPAALSILDTAIEAFDLMKRCEKKIGKDLTLLDRFSQVKAHPLLAVLRDARSQYLAGLKALNLEGTETRPVGRPPGS